MDKKLLDALNNLSFALEEITEAMKSSKSDKNKSATATALSSGKIEKKLQLIDKGIKDIQSDNKKILKNQEELLKIAKSQKESGPVADASDPKKKNKIKDGLGTIMMIAVGIVAIGLAFKIVGGINFVTVIAFALALPLIAFAFEKIAKIEGLSPKKMLIINASLLAMSWTIAKSSVILQGVKPVGFFKLLTAVLIGAAFVGMAYSLQGILESVANVSILGAAKMVLFGPLLLLTMSYAIAWSSLVLGQVKPVGLFKLITAGLISMAFVALSYGLPGILKGMEKLSPWGVAKLVLFGPSVFLALSNAIADSSGILSKTKPVGIFKLFTAILISAAFAAIGYGLGRILDAFSQMKMSVGEAVVISLLIPIILVAIAFAVTGASYAFSKIKVVGIFKIFTAILISIALIPLSYAMAIVAWGLSKITLKQALMLPIILVLLAGAVMLSSYIFAKTTLVDWKVLLNIVLQSITLAIVGIVLGAAMFVIDYIGIKFDDALEGGFVLLAMAAVVMAGSYLFAMTTMIPWSNMLNIVFLSLTLAAVGIILGVAIYVLRFLKIQISDALKGGAVLLVLSGVVMASSWILNQGTYENYPKLKWIIGVAASLTAFGIGAVLLGTQALNPFFYAGLGVILLVARTIIAASAIFANGTYENYPSLRWTMGVVGAIIPFAAMSVALGVTGILASIGFPFVIGIANTIVEISNILASGNYNIPGFVEWSLSTVLLYAAFTPLLLILGAVAMANAVLSVFGANPWESARAMIVQIAETIVEVAGVFNKGVFKGGPTFEWAQGVYIALGAFAPVYGMLVANKITKMDIGPDEFNQAIRTVVGGIMFAAAEFEKGSASFKSPPPKEWAEGVGTAIGAFAPVYKMLLANETIKAIGGKGGIGPEEFKTAIMVVCEGILEAAHFFGKNIAAFDLEKVPKKEWGENVGKAIQAFIPALEYIHKSKGWFTSADPEQIRKGISVTAQGIRDASFHLSDGRYDKTVTKEWVQNTASGVKEFMVLAKWLKENEEKGEVENLNRFIYSISGAAGSLARIDWSKTISPDWVQNTKSGIIEYIDLAMYVNQIEGLDEGGGGGLRSGILGLLYGSSSSSGPLAKLHNVISSMVRVSEDFAKIANNTSRLDDKWMLNVARNVKRYVLLAKWVSGNAFDSWMVLSAVQGMRRVTSSYNQLAKAVDKLNDSLAELDVEKLNALRNLNASVVLMSLMDPEQFKSMMTELEDKGGFLIEALEKVENKEKDDASKTNKNVTTPVKTSGNQGGSAGKTMNDLYSIMEQANTALTKIAADSTKISKIASDLSTKNPFEN